MSDNVLTTEHLTQMMHKMRENQPRPLPDMLVMNRDTWLSWARSGKLKPVYYRHPVSGKRLRAFVFEMGTMGPPKVVHVHIHQELPDDTAFELRRPEYKRSNFSPFEHEPYADMFRHVRWGMNL